MIIGSYIGKQLTIHSAQFTMKDDFLLEQKILKRINYKIFCSVNGEKSSIIVNCEL